MIQIGPMLGRLTPLRSNAGQEFPDDWQKEIDLLKNIGANCIEWIVVDYDDNPLFQNINLKPYPILSINIHALVDFDFNEDFVNKVCTHAMKNNIFKLVLPLIEKSDLSNSTDIIQSVKKIANNYPAINFSIESTLCALDLLPLIVENDNIYVTYDTGNTTAQNFNHATEITILKNKINNIHLKDRLYNGGPNVKPFTGNTNFTEIFKSLKQINYQDTFILETYRGQKGKEQNTVKKYIQDFKCLI